MKTDEIIKIFKQHKREHGAYEMSFIIDDDWDKVADEIMALNANTEQDEPKCHHSKHKITQELWEERHGKNWIYNPFLINFCDECGENIRHMQLCWDV